ncbi:MAG: ATP-binding protein [Chloroflexota bacterium]|nr:ATP-binding protein [Chloroflexota bacterium]
MHITTALERALTAPPTANEPSVIPTTAPHGCAFCDGAGWYKDAVPYGHPNFGKLLACQCRRDVAARQEHTRQRAMLGALDRELGQLAHCRLDNYRAGDDFAHALGVALAYATRPRGWLYLWGSCGTGKSHLASALAHDAAARGLRTSYASAPALLRFIKAGFKDETSDDRLLALQQIDFLVLDDIGAEYHPKPGDFNDVTLFELINHRYLYDRLTVFTSNLRVDDLEPRIGSRIAGLARDVPMIGPDYRKNRGGP